MRALPRSAAKGGRFYARGLLRQRAEEGRDQRRQTGDHEKWPPGDPRRLPRLRDQNLQDRETRGIGLEPGLHPSRTWRRMRSGALKRERDVREAYAAHSGELYGFAMRSLGDSGLAEEAVQETFVRAWRAGERFDPEIGSLRTWLFAILRNVVIDLGRARAARPRVAESGIEPSVEPLDEALLAWQVEEAMRRLGEDHRRVLIETHFRGRPYSEVAAELGVPEGTIKSRVYYGLRALRVVLEEMGYED